MAASDSIKVVCRVRPLNSKEQSNGSSFVVGFPSSSSVSLAVSYWHIKYHFINLANL